LPPIKLHVTSSLNLRLEKGWALSAYMCRETTILLWLYMLYLVTVNALFMILTHKGYPQERDY
jgi:hypothetical protein